MPVADLHASHGMCVMSVPSNLPGLYTGSVGKGESVALDMPEGCVGGALVFRRFDGRESDDVVVDVFLIMSECVSARAPSDEGKP